MEKSLVPRSALEIVDTWGDGAASSSEGGEDRA
ncbi:hypothetical protein COLO4_19974 [Corchorus olitorius]|uniref:Uncharacterized protein n=1 Tax=Corchorus olitorius TaxID=93759 RepID=A0A1R3J2H7_9ROSI|nr:hypothetical protein COLO4_19974 [Corchorus olitorius]